MRSIRKFTKFFIDVRYVDEEKLREINGQEILGMIYDHPFFEKINRPQNIVL